MVLRFKVWTTGQIMVSFNEVMNLGMTRFLRGGYLKSYFTYVKLRRSVRPEGQNEDGNRHEKIIR